MTPQQRHEAAVLSSWRKRELVKRLLAKANREHYAKVRAARPPKVKDRGNAVREHQIHGVESRRYHLSKKRVRRGRVQRRLWHRPVDRLT